MFDDLPSESQTAEMLLRELTDDLGRRVERLRFLIALDQDFGRGTLMLPGGEVSYFAYVEARSSFVAGNFLSAVLAAQCFVENILGGHLIVDETVRPIHGQSALASGPVGRRPKLRQLIDKGIESEIISPTQASRIEQLATIRNPLMHFRDVDDPAQLGRRVLNQRVQAVEIMEADARFALTTVIELASSSGPVIGRSR
jgi:hypothetical protein